MQASNAPGVVTGFFLHRNSPRQEIDIEIAGNRPDRLLVNVFYNPGGEGANFDYGYRGAPSYIELGLTHPKQATASRLNGARPRSAGRLTIIWSIGARSGIPRQSRTFQWRSMSTVGYLVLPNLPGESTSDGSQQPQ